MSLSVTYDFQIFLYQYYGGISRYFFEIARRINAVDDFSARVAAPLFINRYLRSGDGIVRGHRLSREPENLECCRVIDRYATPLVLGSVRTDVLHETYYQQRSVPLKRRTTVLTVYDMIHEQFRDLLPADGYITHLKKQAVSRADHVICISECTRRDLIEYFDIPEDKTSVIHLGCTLTTEETGILPEGVLERPFILYVGTRGGYKNFERLLRAYAASRRLRDSVALVCFGGGQFSSGEKALMAELGLTEELVKLVSGGDELLAALYSRACIFVFPSLYEGFGIPPLEAMRFGCPVACSNSSSIPEVVGDAGSFFEPHDADSIRYCLEALLDSEALRRKLTALGKERARLFSWDRCAEETMSLYRRLVSR